MKKNIPDCALWPFVAGFAGKSLAASYTNGIDPNYPPFAYIDEKKLARLPVLTSIP